MHEYFKNYKLREPLSEDILKDLYYHTEQPDKESYATGDSESELNISKWANSDPKYWDKHALVITERRKKHIIISSFLRTIIEIKNLISVMQELSWLDFPLYFLTKEGKPKRVDIQKIKSLNLQYLEGLFKQSEFLPKKNIREKIASLHKKNPKDFATELLSHESSFILDYFQFQQMIYRRNKDNENIPFQYNILIPPNIGNPYDYLKLLQEKTGFDHHCKLEVESIDPKPKKALEFIKTTPVKSISLIRLEDSGLDPSILEELPADIEELSLAFLLTEAPLNLSLFTHLKKLTLNECAITGLENLPISLQELSILNCHYLVSLPAWSRHIHLKKITLNNLDALKEIPDTPDCLEEMTLEDMGVLPRLTNPRGLKKFEIPELSAQQFEALKKELTAWLKPCSELTHLELYSFSAELFPNKTLPHHLISLRISQSSDQTIVLPDNLQELSLVDFSAIKEISLPSQLKKALFKSNPSLTKIDMTNAHNLQDLAIEKTAVTFSKSSLPGLETLRQLETLLLFLGKQIPTEDPPSLARLPLKVLFSNYSFPEIPLLDKRLQILALDDIKKSSHCNFQEYSELRHLRLNNFKGNSLPIKHPPNLISFKMKNSYYSLRSIYSYNSKSNQLTALLCDDLQPNSSKIFYKNYKIEYGGAGRAESKSSTMGTTTSIFSDSQQSSNIGFRRDTYTDPEKTTFEVPYRIHRKISGQLQPVPASLHRREVFDRCTWQKNTFELAKSQALEEFKPADAQLRGEYTQEDVDKLTPEEYFVQRPLYVAEAGTHSISLDTLKPYDNITQICLPPDSRLLFNPILHSYELEWTTHGSEKATLEYQFSSPPRHPGMDAGTQGTGTLMLRTPQTPPALDKDLVERLIRLFSATKNPSKASDAFTALKKDILKTKSKRFKERWKFCENELAKYCKAFGNVTLKNRSGLEKLEEILVEAKGSCQDRSLVFVMLCHFLGVEARLIGNDIHAFVELKNLHGIWEPMQLGGHDVKQIKGTSKPLRFPKAKPDKKEKESTDSKQPPPEKKEAVTAPKDTPIDPIVREEKWRPYFRNKIPEQDYKTLRDVLEDLVQQQHPAITVDDARAARNFCEAVSHSLAKDQGKRVLYLESPKDLHAFWRPFKMDETGAHGKPGPFQTLLEQGHVIMINWAGFNRTQMAAYKSLMDDPPSFLGTPIPPDKMHFIHLMTTETQGCTSFTSRLKEFTWPQNIPWPQVPSSSLSDKKAESVTIDLYGDSSRWESSLVGAITPTETGLSFTPKKLTGLAKQDSKPLCINLVDVPKRPEFEAFMTRLRVKDGFFIANGEEIPVPSHWRFQYQDPPKQTQLPEQVRSVSPGEWLSQNKEYDRCFLHPGTLSALEEQHQLQTAETSNAEISHELPKPTSSLHGSRDPDDRDVKVSCPNTYKMVGRQGWLQSDHKKIKQLIQTHPLTAGEKRKILDAIATQTQTVEWVDLTKPWECKPNEIPRFARDDRVGTVFPSMKALDERAFGDRKSPHKNHLLETSDPDFVAETLAQDKKNVVTIPIQTITRGSDLIESIALIPTDEKEKEAEKKQRTFTKKPPRFTYQTKPLLEALKAGKTVVLHGQLSEELYRTLQTLFAPDPQLKLSTGTAPEPMSGQLIILTEHMPKETHLARLTQSQGSVPKEALWPAYEARLKKEKIYDKDVFENLQLLYTLAAQSLREEAPSLSYAILKQCVMALKKSPLNDNPIKPWFQHEEPDSSAYAQLNVFAKLILGPAENPTLRTEKLKPAQHIWKRLNCLNPGALRLVMFGKENPTLTDYETLNTLTTETLTNKLNEWLEEQKEKKEYKPRTPQADPYQKTMARMRAHLNTCGAVVLKGPPGSGKTWAAYQYCEAVGSPIFLANDANAITKWKAHKPKPGEKAVLIVDEANLKRRGTWEHLSALISPDHQIIFTRNPNSYGGRVTHPILQRTPTVPVKKWTSQGLLAHILTPLCQKMLGKVDEDKDTLKSLIKIYEYVQTLLPAHQLSIRDLQQVTLRWLRHPQKEREPQLAAYEACRQEWGLRFGSPAIESEFINRLQFEFPVIPGAQSIRLYEKALKDWPEDFYLINPQKKLLEVMAQDLQLAEDCQKFQGVDGAPLAKSGLLIEGPSGFGKSSLIRQFLLSTGHKPLKAEELIQSKEKDLSKCFIQFTLSGDIKKDTDLLRVAFKKGCKVILDELNLDPLIETELNHLLTGKTEAGEKGHPGFFVFATQNDSQMEGRKSVSPALLNRLHVLHTPECSDQHALEAVRSALPHFSKEDQMDVVPDYLAEARADPVRVNFRTLYSGLKEIRKKFPVKTVSLLCPSIPSPPRSGGRGLGRGGVIEGADSDISATLSPVHPGPFAERTLSQHVVHAVMTAPLKVAGTSAYTASDTPPLPNPLPPLPDRNETETNLLPSGNGGEGIIRSEETAEAESVRPEVREPHFEGQMGDEVIQRTGALIPEFVPSNTPPLPNPLPQLRDVSKVEVSNLSSSRIGGEGILDPKLSPPRNGGEGIRIRKFGLFSSPEARKNLNRAAQVYLPFLFSLAAFSMSGVTIAAANKMELGGMLKPYPDYASQYFQADIKRGEIIALTMIVAAMLLLVLSIYNYRQAKAALTIASSVRGSSVLLM